MLTQDDVRDLFQYDEISGAVTRRRDKGVAKRGDSVGTKHHSGYLNVSIDCRTYTLHRLIWLYMTGKDPNVIDHINGDKQDNRWANMRDTTMATNNKNKPTQKNTSSGIVGVFWVKSRGKWKAQIKNNGRSRSIGHYDTIFDAAAARISVQNNLGFHENHGRTNA